MKSKKEIGPSRAMRSRRRSDRDGIRRRHYSLRCRPFGSRTFYSLLDAVALANRPLRSRPRRDPGVRLAPRRSPPDARRLFRRHLGLRGPAGGRLEKRRPSGGPLRGIGRVDGPVARRGSDARARAAAAGDRRLRGVPAASPTRRSRRRRRSTRPTSGRSSSSFAASSRPSDARKRRFFDFRRRGKDREIVVGLFLSGWSSGGELRQTGGQRPHESRARPGPAAGTWSPGESRAG